MKLFLLRKRTDIAASLQPYWGYDCYHGAVIAAKTEAEARAIMPFGDEGDVWKDPELTRAEVIAVRTTLKAGVVITDFHAG